MPRIKSILLLTCLLCYTSAQAIWLSPDPLLDKYPYISPYAYCNWNPVKNIDPNGKWVEIAWDVANIGMDIASLKSNVSAGNVGGAIVDGLGLALDVGATLLPGIPGGAGTVIKASRTADKVSGLGKSGKAINQVITATKSTYRQALQKSTGKLGKGYDAHHTLPQKYRKEFEKLGINIDEPGNVVWRSKENHRQNSNQLTKEWDDFMSNPENRTTESIMKFRDKMEKKYFNNKTGDLQ